MPVGQQEDKSRELTGADLESPAQETIPVEPVLPIPISEAIPVIMSER